MNVQAAINAGLLVQFVANNWNTTAAAYTGGQVGNWWFNNTMADLTAAQRLQNLLLQNQDHQGH